MNRIQQFFNWLALPVWAIILFALMAFGAAIIFFNVMMGLFMTITLFFVEMVTYITMVFGLVDNAWPWAIPVALVSLAFEEPGFATLTVGFLGIVIVRLIAFKLFGWIFSAIQGTNPFSEKTIAGQVTKAVVKRLFDIELEFMSEEDLRKIPGFRALLIKLVLIASFVTIGGEALLLVGDILPAWLELLFSIILLSIAICAIVLAELPGFAGAMYTPARKWETVKTIEDNINWGLKWVLLPIAVTLVLAGFTVNVGAALAHNVVDDNPYYDTFGQYNEETGELETPGYLRKKATEGFVDTLHPSKKGKRGAGSSTPPAREIPMSDRTAEILKELEVLKSR